MIVNQRGIWMKKKVKIIIVISVLVVVILIIGGVNITTSISNILNRK